MNTWRWLHEQSSEEGAKQSGMTKLSQLMELNMFPFVAQRDAAGHWLCAVHDGKDCLLCCESWRSFGGLYLTELLGRIM